MIQLGINFDEISDNLDEAFEIMHRYQVKNGELRTVEGKNSIFFDDTEAKDVLARIHAADINLVAIATPLFKWYTDPTFAEVPHDNFGFNPRADERQKHEYINRMLAVATLLGVKKLRIFSNLSDGSLSVDDFINDPVLAYALDKAQAAGITLMIENEPVCIVNRKAHILEVFRRVQHPNLKLWLDVANLLELGEEMDDDFIAEVAEYTEYLHVKDFTQKDGKKVYHPLGQGGVDYVSVMALLRKHLGDKDVNLSIETHVFNDRKNASSASIDYAQRELGL